MCEILLEYLGDLQAGFAIVGIGIAAIAITLFKIAILPFQWGLWFVRHGRQNQSDRSNKSPT